MYCERLKREAAAPRERLDIETRHQSSNREYGVESISCCTNPRGTGGDYDGGGGGTTPAMGPL